MSAAVEDVDRSESDIRVSSHAHERWQSRAPDTHSPREAWDDAEEVTYPRLRDPAEVARYHDETGMVLLAAPDGTILTVIPLWHRPPSEQQFIESQVTEI